MAVKGKTNNPKGRPPGSISKVTLDLRAGVKLFLDKNWGAVQRTFNKLEPKDKLAFLEKMMKYTIPQLSSIDHTLLLEKENENKLKDLTPEELKEVIELVLAKRNND